MARILNTQQLNKAICKVIDEAQERVCIITPYITLFNDNCEWSSVMDALKGANNRGVHIMIICRSFNDDLAKPYISPEYRDSILKQQNNQIKAKNYLESIIDKSLLHFHYCPFLHAKCYFNESKFIITSLNLTLSSILPKATKKDKNLEIDNKELGVLITKAEDQDLVRQLLLYINSIVEDCSPKLKLISASGILQKKNIKDLLPDEGFCIYCGRNIKYNLNEPICSSCLPEIRKGWPALKRYCHFCGAEGQIRSISEEKPLHYECWKTIYD